jgi:dephospho-CoA kinase
VIVYVTGGIGTGKSSVLQLFAALGAQTISADEVVRALYAEPAMQLEVSEALQEPLPLDRASIAKKVFNDPAALHRLESLVHPRVHLAVEQAERSRGEAEYLFYEVPLLPSPRPDDRVIVVTAPLAIRLERLIQRGLTELDARARINTQPDAGKYGKLADFTIVNAGDLDGLAMAVRSIWEELRSGTSRI